MSFQAYLDNAEKKSGKTPQELIDLAGTAGFTKESKAMEIAAWLKQNFGLGHGHAMAIVHVIKNGSRISSKHVGSDGLHRDESEELRLDGIAKR